MPDYDLEIDGKTYTVQWDKPTPPTDADMSALSSHILASVHGNAGQIEGGSPSRSALRSGSAPPKTPAAPAPQKTPSPTLSPHAHYLQQVQHSVQKWIGSRGREDDTRMEAFSKQYTGHDWYKRGLAKLVDVPMLTREKLLQTDPELQKLSPSGKLLLMRAAWRMAGTGDYSADAYLSGQAPTAVMGQAMVGPSGEPAPVTPQQVRRVGAPKAVAASERATQQPQQQEATQQQGQALQAILGAQGALTPAPEDRAATGLTQAILQARPLPPQVHQALMNPLSFVPHMQESMQGPGRTKGLQRLAAGFVNALPSMLLLGGAGESVGVGGVTGRAFQANMGADLLQAAADARRRREDPGGYWTEVLGQAAMMAAPEARHLRPLARRVAESSGLSETARRIAEARAYDVKMAEPQQAPPAPSNARDNGRNGRGTLPLRPRGRGILQRAMPPSSRRATGGNPPEGDASLVSFRSNPPIKQKVVPPKWEYTPQAQALRAALATPVPKPETPQGEPSHAISQEMPKAGGQPKHKGDDAGGIPTEAGRGSQPGKPAEGVPDPGKEGTPKEEVAPVKPKAPVKEGAPEAAQAKAPVKEGAPEAAKAKAKKPTAKQQWEARKQQAQALVGKRVQTSFGTDDILSVSINEPDKLIQYTVRDEKGRIREHATPIIPGKYNVRLLGDSPAGVNTERDSPTPLNTERDSPTPLKRPPPAWGTVEQPGGASVLKSPRPRGRPPKGRQAGMADLNPVTGAPHSPAARVGAAITQTLAGVRYAFTNGRFRKSYRFGKEVGNGMNTLASSYETASTQAVVETRHIYEGLSPEDQADLHAFMVHNRLVSLQDQGRITDHPQILSPAEQQRILANPRVVAAILKYLPTMESIKQLRLQTAPNLPMAQVRGGVYMSLAGVRDEAGNLIERYDPQARPSGSVAGRFRLKQTVHAKKATGTAAEYEGNLGKMIAEGYQEATQKANLHNLYNTLAQQGLVRTTRGAFEVGGNVYPSEPVEIGRLGLEVVDPATGERVKATTIHVPRPIADDLEDILIRKQRPDGPEAILRGASSFATGLQLKTPAEGMRHAWRVLSNLSRIPNVGDPLLKRFAEAFGGPVSVGLAPKIGRLYDVYNLNMSDPENLQVLYDVMRSGGGSARPFERVLSTRIPGLRQLTDFGHDFLFSIPEGQGLKGFDLRGRVMAEKLRRAVEHNDDPQRTREFVNQFGQWSSFPEKIIGLAKALNPFAGTSIPMRGTEVRQLFGGAGFKGLSRTQALTLRAETLFRGTVGTALGVSMANYLLSGHWPWENDKGHEFDLAVKRDTDGHWIYLSASLIDPGMVRALNLFGGVSTAEDLTQGDRQEVARDLLRAGANVGLEQVQSPLASTLLTASAGKGLYLVKDVRGKNQLIDTVKIGKGDPVAQKQILAAMQGNLPLLGNLGEIAHQDYYWLNGQPEPDSGSVTVGDPLWRVVRHMEVLLGPFTKKASKSQRRGAP